MIAIFKYVWDANANKMVYTHVEDVPYLHIDPKGNNGLPDYYFEDSTPTHGHCSVEIFTDTGLAEFVPGVGPAPTFQLEGGANLPRLELIDRMEKWVAENF
jgi:hypothetical protein